MKCNLESAVYMKVVTNIETRELLTHKSVLSMLI